MVPVLPVPNSVGISAIFFDPVGHGFAQGKEEAPEDFFRIVVEVGPAADALGENGHGHEFDLVQGDHAVLVENEGELVDPRGVFLVFADQTHGHEERVVLVVDGRMLEGEFDIEGRAQDVFFFRRGAEDIDPQGAAHFLRGLHFAGEAERAVVFEKCGDHGRVV